MHISVDQQHANRKSKPNKVFKIYSTGYEIITVIIYEVSGFLCRIIF